MTPSCCRDLPATSTQATALPSWSENFHSVLFLCYCHNQRVTRAEEWSLWSDCLWDVCISVSRSSKRELRHGQGGEFGAAHTETGYITHDWENVIIHFMKIFNSISLLQVCQFVRCIHDHRCKSSSILKFNNINKIDLLYWFYGSILWIDIVILA